MVDSTTPIKPFYQSKTLWLATIVVAMGVLQYVQGQIESGAALSTIGVLFAALRLISTQAVSFNG